MNRIPVAVCAILIAGRLASAQNLGTPPQLSPDTSDIYNAFSLPLNDSPGRALSNVAGKLQMTVRARRLGLTAQSAVDAWTQAQALFTSASFLSRRVVATPVYFSGSTATALNAFLATSPGPYVRVTSPILTVDQPIVPANDATTLDFGTTQLTAANAVPYMIRIVGASGISILGGSFVLGNTAILVSKSSNVLIDHAQISGLAGTGILIAGSTNVTATHNQIFGLGMAAILVNGGSSQCLLAYNDITNGQGQSNWNAGIVVSDRDIDFSQNPQAIFLPGNYWPIYEPVQQRLNPPHDNLIAFNHVALNASSGIYMDGGVRFTIFSNTIQANAKEGMCLDNGATANIVASNTIQQNGKRWGQTDTTLSNDSVLSRLPDGTAAAKLPGVSMDNAMYNIVYGNNISHNFGDGVKMVRTGFFNVIALNTIENDNDGASIYFRYFGVQLGSAPPDASSTEIDFGPSRGNVIFSNLIRGKHGSGIFIQLDSDDNEITDNVIKDANDWAIESVLTMVNSSVNNLADKASQNIVNGCCTMTDRHFPVRGTQP